MSKHLTKIVTSRNSSRRLMIYNKKPKRSNKSRHQPAPDGFYFSGWPANLPPVCQLTLLYTGYFFWLFQRVPTRQQQRQCSRSGSLALACSFFSRLLLCVLSSLTGRIFRVWLREYRKQKTAHDHDHLQSTVMTLHATVDFFTTALKERRQ